MPVNSLRQRSVSTTAPPPIGGWDTRNALADMPMENAVILDNWFPSTDRVTLRRGHSSHATGMSGNVDTLATFVGQNGTEELYAANGGNIFDVTSAGAVGAAEVSSMTNAQWQWVQHNTTGANNLIMVNGDDTPRLYQGSSWGTTAFTGPTVANLIWVNSHQRRLWFGEKNSLTAYYLAVDAITGAASTFHLGGLAKRGGQIMAMATWSRDSGDGMDDAAVFITDQGEVFVYIGIDPSDAANWQLVGAYQIGKPLGRRCFAKFGADLVILTQDGVVPVSKMLLTDRVQAELVAVSQQINKAFNDAVRDGSSLFGWEGLLYPKGTMLVINQPDSATQFNQFVFNTITTAPCRFTGMNARCFGLLNDDAYFGGTDGVVYKFDDGLSDNTANITGDALQAFSYFGAPGRFKAFKMVEPIFQSNGDPSPAVDLQTDFNITNTISPGPSTPTTSGLWGTGLWGSALWGTNNQLFNGWRGVAGVGYSGALRIRVDTTTVRPSWVATNWLYKHGGSV
jgi:hypothetical protein